MDDSTWHLINTDLKPTGRMYHGLAKISNSKLLLFGGGNDNFLNDTWLFTLNPTDVERNEKPIENLSYSIKDNFLTINNPVGLSKIEIYNLLGKLELVFNIEEGSSQKSFDISKLEHGFYIAELVYGKEIKTIKIMK